MPDISTTHVHPTEFEEHMQFRNYMRDLILGANDGLVSVFALVVGVAAGGFIPKEVLLTGIAGMVAGAISMSIGEYISTKSQEEVYDAERDLERKHIANNLDHEIEELQEFYSAKGFEGELLDRIVEKISSDPEILLREMMMAEFGILDAERRSPVIATIIVGIAFAFGSIIPVLAFFFVSSTSTGILISSVLSVIGLFGIGGLKGYVVKGSINRAGMENLLLGAGGAIITFIIGSLVGS